MSLCGVDGRACDCQPDEGRYCTRVSDLRAEVEVRRANWALAEDQALRDIQTIAALRVEVERLRATSAEVRRAFVAALYEADIPEETRTRIMVTAAAEMLMTAASQIEGGK